MSSGERARLRSCSARSPTFGTEKSRIVTYGIASTEGCYCRIGGLLTGFGGITALGHTIGQEISGFSTLAAGSIMIFAAIVTGAAAAMKWQYWRMTREA